MNHEWTRIDTKTDGPPSTTSATKMHLQFGALGVTMSWDEGFLGARASRPHQAWHSLGHLPHLDQPGTAPWLSYGLADAVPAHRMAACSIALKLSGGQRDRMRAGRPRSQAMHDRADHSRVKQGCFRQVERSGSRAPQAPYDLVALFVRTAPRSTRCLTCRSKNYPSKNYPLSTIHYPLSHASAPHGGADHSRVKQALFQVGGIGGRQCVPEGRYSSAAYAAHRWVIEVKFLLINFLH